MRSFVVGGWKQVEVDGPGSELGNVPDVPAGVHFPDGNYGEPASGVFAGEADHAERLPAGLTVVHDESTADERPQQADITTLRTALAAKGIRTADLDDMAEKERVVTQEREVDEDGNETKPEVQEDLFPKRREMAERLIARLAGKTRPRLSSARAAKAKVKRG